MSAEHTGTEVFEDVDPDPDAVLEAFGVESPDELADADADTETGGAHDPIPDERLDVDDTTAAELFADLEALADETPPDGTAEDVPGGTAEADPAPAGGGAAAEPAGESPFGDEVPDDESSPEFEAAFVGEPGVTGREDEGLVEATAAELNAVAARVFASDEPPAVDEAGETIARSDGADSAAERTLTVTDEASDELELVGPDPTPTRLTNERFGADGSDAR